MYFCYIINLQIEKFSLQNQNNQLGAIIGTIPICGSLQIIANSFYQDGVLMKQFTQNNFSQFVVGVYYLNNLLDENLIQPILMQGSFNTTNPNYAMIINKKTVNGQTNNIFFILKQNFILLRKHSNSQTVSKWNFTIFLLLIDTQLQNKYLEYHMYFKQPHVV
ncbi:unnamed protein product [Paramecium pentaurelia]|uniref:Uncharacterized protein n=1 Tax=Paramecium pentaurelia TaxID=43138 RepID=A0A8S1YRD1_9CILI|nr:unnamed protein product [Paramecium pentaurelia]